MAREIGNQLSGSERRKQTGECIPGRGPLGPRGCGKGLGGGGNGAEVAAGTGAGAVAWPPVASSTLGVGALGRGPDLGFGPRLAGCGSDTTPQQHRHTSHTHKYATHIAHTDKQTNKQTHTNAHKTNTQLGSHKHTSKHTFTTSRAALVASRSLTLGV